MIQKEFHHGFKWWQWLPGITLQGLVFVFSGDFFTDLIPWEEHHHEFHHHLVGSFLLPPKIDWRTTPNQLICSNDILGGRFKYVLFSHLFGEDFSNLTSIFFRSVGFNPYPVIFNSQVPVHLKHNPTDPSNIPQVPHFFSIFERIPKPYCR